MVLKCLVLLLIFAVCLVSPEDSDNSTVIDYDAESGNSSFLTEVKRVKRLDDYETPEYYDDGTGTTSKSKILLYTCVMYLSAVFIIIQMLVTIYGNVLPDHPIRWHTLNYCCWNVFQLLVFANCADESEFKKFLFNSYLTANCEAIQKATLTVYYQYSIIFSNVFCNSARVVTVLCARIKDMDDNKYYVTIPCLVALDIGLLIIYLSEPFGWWIKGYAPVDLYQACTTLLNFGFVIVLLCTTLCLIIRFGYYFCQYNARPDAELYKHFTNLLNFILFFCYYLAITILHGPKNGVGMGLWFAPFIYKWILPYTDILIEAFLPIATSIMEVQDIFMLFIPTAEFFATFICLKIYRHQLLQCLSCGQFTHQKRRLTQNTLPIVIRKKSVDKES